LAIVFPLQMGADWVRGGFAIMMAGIVPLLLVGTTIPDAFAGERERHTLPTLLATRLPDRAIFLGKMIVPILFGWSATIILLLISLIPVNILASNEGFLFYRPAVLIGGMLFGLLVAVLTASAGVLLSLRSETVQEAQQTLMFILLIPLMLVQAVGFLALGTDAGREFVEQVLVALTLEQYVLLLCSVVLLLDVGLFIAARRRFQRARLIQT
jgi:ABC-2 type transport system permease protein